LIIITFKIEIDLIKVNYHVFDLIQMKCTVFVLVRTESKRLRKKALLKIKEKHLIKILLDRISSDEKEIIVCTTNLSSDDKLVNLLKKENCEVFRGKNSDILFRLYSCAKFFKKNEFVVVEGDDLFCDPKLIDMTCKEIRKRENELVVWDNLPFGVSPTGLKLKKLEKLIKINKIKNIETGWIKKLIDSKKIKVTRMKPKNKTLLRPEIRLSIDYKEDLLLAEKILQSLPNNAPLIDIIKILNEHPNWLDINRNTIKKYEENFIDETTKIRKNKGISK
jgi:spore coat polysaccharide biosynthesis protein SpsF